MTTTPTFGICLFGTTPAPVFVDLVRRIEGAGFSTFWLADTVLKARDAFCYLTLAAVNSTRLTVGPGVLHPYSRHIAVAVNAMRTLEEIAPGRVVSGWGTGGSGIGELGLKPARMQTLRAIAEISRRLDAGEAVTASVPGAEFAEASLRFPERRAVPVYFAATGPKMLQLSGEVADGVLAHVGAAPANVRHAFEQVAAGGAARDARLGKPRVSLYVYASVSERGGPISMECRRGVAALLGRTRIYAELAGVPAAEIEALEEAGSAAAIATAASEDTMRRLSISGDSEACADRIAELIDAGLEDFTFVPTGPDIAGTIDLFGERILPRFL